MKLRPRCTNTKALKGFFVTLIAGLLIAVVTAPAAGHGIFKKTLEKKYKAEGLRVTCYMCHIKKEPKTVRNEVGQMFFKEFEGQDLSSRWEAVEDDERKKIENEVMAPAFLKALEEVFSREAAGKSDTTFSIQLPLGEVKGTKLKKKKKRD